jgi:hypothetical protein
VTPRSRRNCSTRLGTSHSSMIALSTESGTFCEELKTRTVSARLRRLRVLFCGPLSEGICGSSSFTNSERCFRQDRRVPGRNDELYSAEWNEKHQCRGRCRHAKFLQHCFVEVLAHIPLSSTLSSRTKTIFSPSSTGIRATINLPIMCRKRSIVLG